jgi:hypothetical protein
LLPSEKNATLNEKRDFIKEAAKQNEKRLFSDYLERIDYKLRSYLGNKTIRSEVVPNFKAGSHRKRE